MKKKLTLILSLLLALALLCSCGSNAKSSAASAPQLAPAAADFAYVEEAAAEPEIAFNSKAMAAGGVASNGTARSDTTFSAAAPADAMQSEKIIYSANAELETVKYDETVQAVNDMVAQYGGFIEASSVSGANYYQTARGYKNYRSASFTIRIPSEHFKTFTGTLSSLGNVPYCNTSSENVTAQYYDVQSRMEAYQAQHDRLIEMLAIAESVEDLLAIQSQLSDVDYQIDSLQSRLTNYDRRVSYSTVYLNVQEVEEYTETPAVVLTYWEKLQQGFSRSLKSVGEFFSDLFLWLGSNLPMILLWLVILTAAFLLLRRRYENRVENREKRMAKREAKKAKRLAKRSASPEETKE